MFQGCFGTFVGRFGILTNVLEGFGMFWDILGRFMAFFNAVGRFATFWDAYGTFLEHFLKFWDIFGRFWSVLIWSGQGLSKNISHLGVRDPPHSAPPPPRGHPIGV